jgi:hypothetical protein
MTPARESEQVRGVVSHYIPMASLIITGGSISSNRQRSSSMAAMLTGCRSTRVISVSVSSTVSESRYRFFNGIEFAPGQRMTQCA